MRVLWTIFFSLLIPFIFYMGLISGDKIKEIKQENEKSQFIEDCQLLVKLKLIERFPELTEDTLNKSTKMFCEHAWEDPERYFNVR